MFERQILKGEFFIWKCWKKQQRKVIYKLPREKRRGLGESLRGLLFLWLQNTLSHCVIKELCVYLCVVGRKVNGTFCLTEREWIGWLDIDSTSFMVRERKSLIICLDFYNCLENLYCLWLIFCCLFFVLSFIFQAFLSFFLASML